MIRPGALVPSDSACHIFRSLTGSVIPPRINPQDMAWFAGSIDIGSRSGTGRVNRQGKFAYCRRVVAEVMSRDEQLLRYKDDGVSDV